jgi:integrase
VPFKRPNRSTWYVTLRLPGGEVRRSCGTADRPTARSIERALRELEQTREWELLNAVVDGKISLGTLYDAVRSKGLETLRVALSDVDLEPFVNEWARVHARTGVKSDTIAHYLHAVRSFMREGVPCFRSTFSKAALDKWLSVYPGSAGTRLKAHAAMSQFAKFLVRRDVIGTNYMRDVQRPRVGPPRVRFLDESDMKRLAEAQDEPYRTLSALLGGSGVEVSVAMALRRRDVDVAHREVRAAGTKTHSRDRVVRVAEWAWPYLEARCVGLPPDVLLFSAVGVDRWSARSAHHTACEALSIADYTQRDARHSYAVRAIRSGVPAEVVARQLGHANAVLVLKVYGRFAPNQQERDKWERVASAAATQRAQGDAVYQSVYHTAPTEKGKSPNPLGVGDLPYSRGGTRTRDPGIMSAVL